MAKAQTFLLSNRTPPAATQPGAINAMIEAANLRIVAQKRIQMTSARKPRPFTLCTRRVPFSANWWTL